MLSTILQKENCFYFFLFYLKKTFKLLFINFIIFQKSENVSVSLKTKLRSNKISRVYENLVHLFIYIYIELL